MIRVPPVFSVVGFDLSLTGTAVCVVDAERWEPGDWSSVRVTRIAFSTLPKDATPHARALRIRDIANLVWDFVEKEAANHTLTAIYVESYGFAAKHRGMDLAELGGVVKDRALDSRYSGYPVPVPVTAQQARKLLLGVGSGERIKTEVVLQLARAGAPFAQVVPNSTSLRKVGVTKSAIAELTDVCDAFAVANWGLSDVGLPALTLAR